MLNQQTTQDVDTKKVPLPVITGLYSGTLYDDSLCEIVTEFNKGIIGDEYRFARSRQSQPPDWNHLHLYGPGSLKQHEKKSSLTRGADVIKGSSMKENVHKTIGALKTKFGKEDEFVYNMVGWSRGAVTCVAVANEMKKEFPNAKINLFLIDPVPGLGQHIEENLTVPDNVEHLVVNYAQGEIGFRAKVLEPANLIISDKTKTNFEIIRTPGLHYSAVDHFWAGSQDEPNLVWGALYYFLKNHGVKIDPSKIKQHYRDNVHNKTGMIDFIPPTDAELVELTYQVASQMPKKAGRGTIGIWVDKVINVAKEFVNLESKVNFPVFILNQLLKVFNVREQPDSCKDLTSCASCDIS